MTAVFIWLGSQYGLNRFDGSHVRQFVPDDRRPGSISGAYVHALAMGHDGQLWVSTDEQLDRYDPKTERFTQYAFWSQSSCEQHSFVRSIHEDDFRKLWLSTPDGLLRLDPASGRLDELKSDGRNVNSLASSDIMSTVRIGQETSGSQRMFRSTCSIVQRDQRPVTSVCLPLLRQASMRTASERSG